MQEEKSGLHGIVHVSWSKSVILQEKAMRKKSILPAEIISMESFAGKNAKLLI